MRITASVFTGASRRSSVDKVVKDYMKIEYADDGSSLCSGNPAGRDSEVRRVRRESSRSSTSWATQRVEPAPRRRFRTAVQEIAQDLVKLYAARQAEERLCRTARIRSGSGSLRKLFPYEETEDQLAAIEATKRDMESTKIMDRLICGDVGYGKDGDRASGPPSRPCRRASRWFIWCRPRFWPSSITTPSSSG